MGPLAMVTAAKEVGLTHIALADHNTTRNIPAFAQVCKQEGITFFPAIEITSAEEAHILCYFPDVPTALIFGTMIEESLLPIPLNPEKMGYQVVVNSDEEVVEMIEHYLGVSSSLSLSEIIVEAHKVGAFVVPAHVDKPLFSVISQLGFIPQEEFAAVEISAGGVRDGFAGTYTEKYPLLTSSDCHYLGDIGKAYVQVETTEKCSSFASFLKEFIRCGGALIHR